MTMRPVLVAGLVGVGGGVLSSRCVTRTSQPFAASCAASHSPTATLRCLPALHTTLMVAGLRVSIMAR